jgi:microcystin-dependent protein
MSVQLKNQRQYLMHPTTQRINAITLLVLALTAAPVVGQITAFNYTGFLLDGGSPANGSNDLQFALYAAPSGGSPLAGSVTKTNQPVNNGVFVVSLDFGDVFDGSARWLEISARPGGSANEFTNTFPRQAITAAPYAAFANNGMPPGAITAFAGTNVPTGWLLCQGQPLSSAQYPRLYAAISTNWGGGYEWNGSTWIKQTTNDFNAPELRGVFLRGATGANTNAFADPDVQSRTNLLPGGTYGNRVGSFQTNQVQLHKHDVSSVVLYSGSVGIAAGGNYMYGHPPSIFTGNTGGNETRPKNAYVNYIIKY